MNTHKTHKRRLAAFEDHVLAFLERQRVELAAETGRLWERLPEPPQAPSSSPQAPLPSPLPPADGLSSAGPKGGQPGAASKPPRQRPQPPAQPQPLRRPGEGGGDIEARVRALLDAVEARVRAKVREDRV